LSDAVPTAESPANREAPIRYGVTGEAFTSGLKSKPFFVMELPRMVM